MDIIAIRMFDGGFMNQSFAFGGEEICLTNRSFTAAVSRTSLLIQAMR